MEIAASRFILPVLIVCLNCVPSAYGQRSDFEFTVSGELSDKLEPGTRVLLWSPVMEPESQWVRFSVADMPVSVPFVQIEAGHNWYATFTSPTQRRRVFSVFLSHSLFDKPRRIDMKLDRPRPHIRPSGLGRLQFQYCPRITQRMRYSDLPHWDKDLKRLVATKRPVMSITRVSDGAKIQESEMEEGCMGSTWWAEIDRSFDLGKRVDLKLHVRYDSGGLWEPMETELSFTYHETLHGHGR